MKRNEVVQIGVGITLGLILAHIIKFVWNVITFPIRIV